MKNYTKLLSEQMVTVMDKYNNYEETEKIVISYGMELFLNSVLKTSIYLLIGMVAGKGVEVILAMTIFGGVRKISGGIQLLWVFLSGLHHLCYSYTYAHCVL